MKETLFGELFSGLKLDKCGICANYNTVQCFRKIVWAILIMTSQNLSHYGTTVIMIVFHAPFPILTLILRPYERPINNLIEFMIDSLLLGVSIWLLVFKDFTFYNNDSLLAGHYIVLGWITLISFIIIIDILLTSVYRVINIKKLTRVDLSKTQPVNESE